MNILPWHDANNGAPNTMFRNEGDWNLKNVTAEIGLDEKHRRYSYAASWDDFDKDGDQDLYVANDFGRNNRFVNHVNKTGRFQDSDKAYGAEDQDLENGFQSILEAVFCVYVHTGVFPRKGTRGWMRKSGAPSYP